MALIRRPPPLELVADSLRDPKVAEFFASREFAELARRANEKYWHWDSFRHRPMPNEMPPAIAWAGLRLARRLNAKDAPFADVDGKPFTFWLPDSVLKNLHYADCFSGHFLGSEKSVPPRRERYIISSLIDEAISSSQLEGAATTRRVAKDMLRSGRSPRDKSERMIWNNWQTIQHLREGRDEPFSIERIRELHSMITDGTLDDGADAGRVRTANDVQIVDRRSGQIIHSPPDFGVLPERLQALCDFANHDDEDNWIHPVIKAAILHFWLAYDHPFVDGNGRTARALFYWYLLSHGYWLIEYLSISRYFLRAPIQYARSFQETETDGGDLTYFLHFNLRVMRLALDDLYRHLEEKQRDEKQFAQQKSLWCGFNERQRELLLHARKNPDAEYSIAGHQRANNIAYATARSDLLNLAQRGALVQQQRGKKYVFIVSAKSLSE